MDGRMKEALRYLGYGRHAVDERTMGLIEDSFAELEEVADRKFVYRIFELIRDGEADIRIGRMQIHSASLGRNMKGCTHAALIGATLGIGVDMRMKRHSLNDMARVVVLQACASVMLEEYLDECQAGLEKELEAQGRFLRPRFSPGYGDFLICHQSEILRMLDAPKKIGLTMTDGYMLTPVKSVTAAAGISTTKEPCHIRGCESCGKRDCSYRRN